jgi:predicted dehydrogenase
LGLAGFGWLAQKYYAPALRALKGVHLSVVIDPLAASRAAARAAFPGVAALNDPATLQLDQNCLLPLARPTCNVQEAA